jgi:hypothetical protein
VIAIHTGAPCVNRCKGGPNNGQPCTGPNDCPGGVCVLRKNDRNTAIDHPLLQAAIDHEKPQLKYHYYKQDWRASGAQEVPANGSTATAQGTIFVSTDENKLYFDLTHNVANETAAHIHGPAPRGQNAGVLFALPAGPTKVGQWFYPEHLEKDIVEGRMYINIHSQAFPNGEIRGQIEVLGDRVPGVSPWGMVALVLLLGGTGAALFRRSRTATG